METYDLLEVPRITATYALTSQVTVISPSKVSIHIHDRVFADREFGSGRIVEEDRITDGKDEKELAPRPHP